MKKEICYDDINVKVRLKFMSELDDEEIKILNRHRF